MTKKERGKMVVERLKTAYPATCSLVASNDYELLFSTRLSAQCTDARVNIVTKVLFKHFPTLKSLADADIEEICEIVKPCGLYHTKGRDIKLGAMMLLSDYDGKVPDSMDELLKIPGVGRKTANLVLSDIFGHPAIVADTHCIRISNRLGLCTDDDPFKVEMELKKIIEPSEQAPLCHRLVHFGRDICKARGTLCPMCLLRDICKCPVA